MLRIAEALTLDNQLLLKLFCSWTGISLGILNVGQRSFIFY
jgi:hypothetical protein